MVRGSSIFGTVKITKNIQTRKKINVSMLFLKNLFTSTLYKQTKKSAQILSEHPVRFLTANPPFNISYMALAYV